MSEGTHTLVWTPDGLAIHHDHPDTEAAGWGWFGTEVNDAQRDELIADAKRRADALREAAPDDGWEQIDAWTLAEVAEVWDGDGDDGFTLADGQSVRHNGSDFYVVSQWCSIAPAVGIDVAEMADGAKHDGTWSVPVAEIVDWGMDEDGAWITRLAPPTMEATS